MKISVAKNPDLIEQNEGHFRTQSIKISLIQLENPGRLSKTIFLPSVMTKTEAALAAEVFCHYCLRFLIDNAIITYLCSSTCNL